MFIQLTLGLIVGAVILIATITYMGWTSELFARQSIYRSWWMWLGSVVVAIPIVLRVGHRLGRNAVPLSARWASPAYHFTELGAMSRRVVTALRDFTGRRATNAADEVVVGREPAKR